MDRATPDLAELYDLDCDEYRDDVPFFESLVRRTGGPLLELGVGTARVALTLARAGFDVWGIDASEEMLARARCKAEAEKATKIHLLAGRMESFELDQRFGLIYAAFGTFHHLLTDDDQTECLRCVERHLLPRGIFACDLRPLFFEDWEDGDSVPLFHDWTRNLPRTGERVMKFRAVRSDASSRLKSESHIFDILSSDGSVRRVIQESRLWFVSRDEIEMKAANAGLQAEGVYGGYHGEAFDEAGDHLVLVARKLEGTS